MKSQACTQTAKFRGFVIINNNLRYANLGNNNISNPKTTYKNCFSKKGSVWRMSACNYN